MLSIMKKDQETNYGDFASILHPFLKSGETTLLYAIPGTGTSWLSTMLAYTAVSGGSFPAGQWGSLRRHKVLYITSHVEATTKQLITLWDSIGKINNPEDFIIYPKPIIGEKLEPERWGDVMDYIAHVDITLTDFWEKIHDSIVDADVVVIDCLSNFLRACHSREDWGYVFDQIDHYKHMGGKKRAFLLVNHSLIRSGKPIGPYPTLSRADTIIRIKKPFGFKKTVSFSVMKSKSITINKELKRIKLRWRKNATTGRFEWWLIDRVIDDEITETP